MTTRRAGELVDAQPPPAEEGHAGPRDGQAAAARGSLVLVRDMIQHHPSIMLVIDPVADAIVDANDAALSFYGLTREAFLSAPLCERVIDPGTHRTASGAQRQVVVQVGPVPTNGRALELWVVTDATAQHLANQDAKRVAFRLREAERMAKLGTWDAEVPDGRVKLSDGLCEIYGRAPLDAESVTGWFLQVTHPDDRADMEAWKASMDGGHGPSAHAFRVVRPDGSIRHVRGNASLTLGADGMPERALGVVQDVTAEVEGVQALRDREERLQLAVAAGRHGLFDLDLVSGKAVVNDEYATMLGYDPRTFVETNQAWRERVHPDDLEHVAVILEDYVSGRTPEYHAELRQRTANGDWLWILSTGKIVDLTPGGTPSRMLGTHTDISELKRNEERVARHAARARALLELSQLAVDRGEHAFLVESLTIAERLTQSQIAFAHFVNDDQQTLELTAWSKLTLTGCEAVLDSHYPIDAAGVWADAVRHRAPVVINDYPTNPTNHGLPSGHAPLARAVTVPVLHDGGVRMVLGVGNRSTDYEPFDVETLQLLSERIWQIVAQRRSIAAVAEGARFNSLLLENLAEGVVACDAQGRLSVFNKSARAWHGAPHNPLLSPESWAASYDLYEEDGVTPLDTERIPLKRAFNGEAVVDAVICILAKGQAPRLALCSGGPIFDDAGAKVGALMVLHDVTEISASRAKQSLQSAALDAAANAIMITDRDGRMEWANPAFTELTGFDVDEALGRNPRELLRSGTHNPSFYAEMWSTIAGGRVWSGELTNQRKDGTLYPEAMTITPVRDASGEIKHFIAIKRALTAERALQAQLMQAQKMESVGRLAGGIAHDFNNLLTVINGTIELSLSEMTRDDPLYEDLEEVRTAAGRAATLTRQLLAFSRQQILKREPIRLDGVIRDLSKMLRRLIGEDIELVTTLEPSGTVLADAGQIEQVIVNLVVNARDAMPTGGRLEISTRDVCWEAGDPLRDPAIAPGCYVEVKVSDSGLGMDAATQARLFEPFFTTKEVGKGTGLGLATVYGIVSQTGGRILAKSGIGKGTTFLILLPLTDAPATTTVAPAPAPMPAARRHAVMIVDDEPALRGLAERMLVREGYEVLAAQNGFEALRMLDRDDAPSIDLLLTDIIMPGMSGAELVAKLRVRRADLRVLFMSGYTDDRVVHHGVDPRDDLLNKPFTVAELTQRVAAALDQS